MLRRPARLLAVMLAALLLAACDDITIVFDPIISGTVEAAVFDPLGGLPPEVLESGTIPGRGTHYYEVEVPTDRDLLYVEALGSDLRVTLHTVGGSTLGVSTTPRFFAGSLGALPAAAEVEPASLTVQFLCAGPCVAARPQSTRYVVAVRNLATLPRDFDLLAYTMLATDENEPNDSVATAVPFGPSDSAVGAIEWIGDNDWFVYTGVTERLLELTVYDLDVGIQLQFRSDGATLRGDLADATILMRAGDEFRVYSAKQRAGPSSTSRYLLTSTP